MTLSATVVWEIRTDGNVDNGGGYKSNAGTTDYSQQAAAQLSLTDLACASNTTLTSATGGFTAAMVGNIVKVASGTNALAGWYEITGYTNTNTVTIDRTCATGGNMTSGVGKVGGALNGIGTLGLVLSTAAQAVAGMKAYVRGGTYSLTGTTVNTDGGPLDLDAAEQDSKAFYLKGYDAAQSRDSFAGTRPVIDCNNQAPTSVIKIKSSQSEGHIVAFLDILGDADTSRAIDGIAGSNQAYDKVISCIVRNCDGTYAFRGCQAIYCYALSCLATGFFGFQFFCVAKGCEIGFLGTSINCIAVDCTSDSFGNSSNPIAINCVSYNSSADGFDDAADRSGIFINCVSYTDGGYAFNTQEDTILVNCASDGAASGRTNITPWIDLSPITITGDPFTNAAAFDFSLDWTANQGALLRAAGFSPYGQTGYLDVGAVQSLPDFPAVGNVTTDDTVNNVPGTFAVPAEADVESGVQYGEDGTEFTGTLVGGGGAGGGLPIVGGSLVR